MKFFDKKGFRHRGITRIELKTSCTLSENHTTKQNIFFSEWLDGYKMKS